MSEFTSKARRRWVKPLLFTVAALLIGVIVVEGIHWWRHVDEPSARVEVDFTLLSSSVNATVKAVHVRRGDRVEKGALLASMDTAVAGRGGGTLEAGMGRERAARDTVEADLAR
ncbi:MAG: biotin/lipoyl-binding protein [Alphaproteobacteria bacterium]|nr:biotin/lipoyl-binding protein [Alphaproteobacteria bacterium]